jgi:hypothetical protein
MTDREKWEMGVAAVREDFAAHSLSVRGLINNCVAAIKSCKESLHLIGSGVAAGEICASCGGECCKSGKNHVRAVDIVVYLNDGKEIFTPSFEREICPYLDENGCLMEPEYRPFNCVTFICEQVEGLLEVVEKERFNDVERRLRVLYGEMEQILDTRFRYGILSVCERGDYTGQPAEVPYARRY